MMTSLAISWIMFTIGIESTLQSTVLRIQPAVFKPAARHYELPSDDDAVIERHVQDAGSDLIYAVLPSASGSVTVPGPACLYDTDAALADFCLTQITTSHSDSFIYPVIRRRTAVPPNSIGRLGHTSSVDVIRGASASKADRLPTHVNYTAVKVQALPMNVMPLAELVSLPIALYKNGYSLPICVVILAVAACSIRFQPLTGNSVRVTWVIPKANHVVPVHERMQPTGDSTVPCHSNNSNDDNDDCADGNSGSGDTDLTVFLDDVTHLSGHEEITNATTASTESPSVTSTMNDSLVVVVDMTERSPVSRHHSANTGHHSVPRPLIHHVQSADSASITDRVKTFSSSWLHAAANNNVAVDDVSGSEVMVDRAGRAELQRLVLNVSLIVGIAGGLSALVFLLAAIVYCGLLHVVSASSSSAAAANSTKCEPIQGASYTDAETLRFRDETPYGDGQYGVGPSVDSSGPTATKQLASAVNEWFV